MGFLSVARSLRRPASRGIWLQLTLRRARRSGPWVTASRVSSSSHEHLGGLTSSKAPRPPGAVTFQRACVPGHATPSPRGTPTPPRPPGHGAQLCSGSNRLLLQRQCRPPEHECPSQHGSAQQAPPRCSAIVRHQVRAGDTPGSRALGNTACVFTVHFNLHPNPTSYLTSPYCTEQETEAPDGQGGHLKLHGW